MEDKYNAFGQFLKKKLKEDALENSDWAKPDAEVRKALVQQISNVTTAATIAPAIGLAKILWVAASIIVLGLGGYAFHLHQINTQLNAQNAEINTQNTKLKTVLESKTTLQENDALTDAKQKNAEELAALLQEKIAVEILNETINQQNETLKQQVDQQINTLAQLRKDKQSLLEQNETCHLNETANQKQLNTLNNVKGLNKQLEKQLTLQQKRITQLELLNKNWASTICLPDSGEQLDEKKDGGIHPLEMRRPMFFSGQWMLGSKKKESMPTVHNQIKRNRFEIGYSYTFSKPDIWIESSFENEDGFPQTYYGYGHYPSIGFHGLRIAWSPQSRFWIKTGLSLSSQLVTTYFRMAGNYVNTGEVNTPESTVRNQISLITKSEYVETTNPISFEFNRGDLLENDPMQIEIEDIQNLNFHRIPVGLEYYYGGKRLRGSVSGGLRWTRISGTHIIQANVRTNKGEIKTINGEEFQPIKPKLFMDIYAGAGLDYQLLQNWHAKANFSLHHKFVKRDIYAVPKSADLDLGLYYRF